MALHGFQGTSTKNPQRSTVNATAFASKSNLCSSIQIHPCTCSNPFSATHTHSTQALLSDDLTLLNAYLNKIRTEFNQKVQREQYRRQQLNADPLNPEYQKQIQQEMQQEHINQNYATAVEEMPEAFGRVVMLYVPMEIEGVKVNAFIDSGAQSTIMSKEYAIKCNLMRLVDTRFAGVAKGVGTAKVCTICLIFAMVYALQCVCV